MNKWYAYKEKQGGAIPVGPFSDLEQLKRSRDHGLPMGAEVSPHFEAEDEEEAKAYAKFYLEGGRDPKNQ